MTRETTEDSLETRQDLQQRLTEAEETLLALRTGRVDAIVASGPDGDRVYTLTGADEAYRIMVESMAEGAITLTRDGLILFSNEQFAQMLEMPLQCVVGSYLHDFVAPIDAPVLSALLSDPPGTRAELRLKKGLEALMTAQVSANTLIFDGTECICLILMDLTELKRNQEQALTRQKLESLGTLASGIAHDFNNLMGAILSQTELALAELPDGTSPEAELEHIREIACRGAEIVRQLMIYAGQEKKEFELLDVSRLIEETAELLKVVASNHITLRFRLDSTVPAVLASPSGMRQILINLVKNGSEAVGALEGTVEVATSRFRADRDPANACNGAGPGDYVRIEVSDTGCGMTPETQARIFDPFFTTKFQGRGLGLATVLRIVRGLGGTITARSQLSHGTTFEILLPSVAGSAERDPDPAEVPGSDVPVHKTVVHKTVLVVEDEHALRLPVARLLRKEGLVVLEAAEGAEALEILSHRRDITAMLLDVTLPGLPSTEILCRAEQLRPDLKVILTSAHSEMSVTEMFAGLGSLPFLRKPYRVADLLKILR